MLPQIDLSPVVSFMHAPSVPRPLGKRHWVSKEGSAVPLGGMGNPVTMEAMSNFLPKKRGRLPGNVSCPDTILSKRDRTVFPLVVPTRLLPTHALLFDLCHRSRYMLSYSYLGYSVLKALLTFCAKNTLSKAWVETIAQLMDEEDRVFL